MWVYLSDIPATDIAEYGRILPLPGDENAWFEMLPEPSEGGADIPALGRSDPLVMSLLNRGARIDVD